MKKNNCCTDDYGIYINIALLLLRITIGVLMFINVVPKIEKLIAGDFSFPDPVGLGSMLSLILATFVEFFCSIFIIIGLRSRLAAIPLIIIMLIALLIVNGHDPIYDHWDILLYIFIFGILIHLGGGKYSLTYYMNNKKSMV